MPQIRRTVTLTANGTSNPLSGSPYEFLPFNALVEIALLAAAGGNVEAFVSSGSDILLENSPIDEKAITLPITREDFTLSDVAAAGERLTVHLRETAGETPVVRVAVNITPMM